MIAAIIISGAANLDTCGDKFLRVGRSARFRRYAAVHPAVILIYTPANSTPAGMKEFEAVLKHGHRPVAVGNGANVPLALAREPYNLVIADYSDAGKIRQDLQGAPSKPRLLPHPLQAYQGNRNRSGKGLRLPDQAGRDDQVRRTGRNRQADGASRSRPLAPERHQTWAA